jgi:hypothetical protein
MCSVQFVVIVHVTTFDVIVIFDSDFDMWSLAYTAKFSLPLSFVCIYLILRWFHYFESKLSSWERSFIHCIFWFLIAFFISFDVLMSWDPFRSDLEGWFSSIHLIHDAGVFYDDLAWVSFGFIDWFYCPLIVHICYTLSVFSVSWFVTSLIGSSSAAYMLWLVFLLRYLCCVCSRVG